MNAGRIFRAVSALRWLCFCLTATMSFVAARAAPPLKIETIATDLDSPHALAFLPNGDLLIAEKIGRIVILRDGHVLETPVANVPKVKVGQLSGLMDIAADPSFSENGQIFFSYNEGEHEPSSLVLAKARLENNALVNIRRILELEPTTPHENLWGGYFTFWRDGTLLVAVGDGGDTRIQAQRYDSLLGKVLRIDQNGAVPSDNPFVSSPGKRPEIFTLGHRHMIGLLYDRVQDIVYANENGPYGGDEVNVLQPGRNYGWPIATYGMDYSGAYISPYTEYPGTEQPILHWTPSIAPSGMTQCRKCQWPEWEGDLFTGALSGRKVMRVKVAGAKVLEQEPLFADLGYRIRDVEFGPEGALYVLTDEPKGRLLKITPAGEH